MRKGSVDVLLVLLLFLSLFYFTQAEEKAEYVKMTSVSVKQLDNVAKVTLKSGCYRMSFYTTLQQGLNIELALNDSISPRPSTHELLVSILRHFGISVEELRIVKLENGTYYGELILFGFGVRKTVDTRPSDGVTIALRTGAPIKVRKELLENECLTGPF